MVLFHFTSFCSQEEKYGQLEPELDLDEFGRSLGTAYQVLMNESPSIRLKAIHHENL